MDRARCLALVVLVVAAAVGTASAGRRDEFLEVGDWRRFNCLVPWQQAWGRGPEGAVRLLHTPCLVLLKQSNPHATAMLHTPPTHSSASVHAVPHARHVAPHAPTHRSPQAGKWTPPSFCYKKDCPEFSVKETADNVELRTYTAGQWAFLRGEGEARQKGGCRVCASSSSHVQGVRQPPSQATGWGCHDEAHPDNLA